MRSIFKISESKTPTIKIAENSSHLKVAGTYIAMLKAMTIIHQHGHWAAKGSQFYGEHQMFERIYKSAQENLDTAVEKFIGLFGSDVLDYSQQTEALGKVLEKYTKSGSSIERSLAIENDFIKFSKEIFNLFEKEDVMTLGLDDMIMATSSDREEALYLLQQSSEK